MSTIPIIKAVLLRISTIVLLVAILPLPSQGQNPFDKLQQKAEEAAPRGRFFKKLREDIASARDGDAKEKADRGSEGGPSNRETGGRQSSTGSGFRPPTFGLPNPFAAQSQNDQANRSAPAFRFSQPDFEEMPQPNPNLEPRTRQWDTADSRANKVKGPPRVGFGMKLKERDEGLFVDEIDPRGNAHEAQLKRGDKVTKIGGVEVESQEQFNEIAGMLGNGDQIDVVISRRGKESQVTLQFGDSQVAGTQIQPSQVESAPRLPFENDGEIEPPILAPGEINDFAPPVSNEPGVSEFPAPAGRSNSVLERDGQSSANGFRQPTIPQNNGQNSQSYSPEQLVNTIRQQQKVIRQLEQQLQQMERQRGRR